MEPTHVSEWDESIARSVETAQRVLVVGDTDTGKTTFCARLAGRAIETGRRVAVVDGDIGQSEIGPPGCVGVGLLNGPFRNLAEIEPLALSFVGALSPRGRLLEHAVAVRAMADAALREQPDLLIVDTTGFVRGAPAQRLKQAKIALLAPDVIVALQRSGEAEPLLLPLRLRDRPRIERLAVPPFIAAKPAVYRAQRRKARFARYFADAEIRTYAFDAVAMAGTWLNTGRPLAPHLVTFLQNALGARVFYAEEGHRHLGLLTGPGAHVETGLPLLQEQFRAQAITITRAAQLQHLLLGLTDGDGRLQGLGLIEAVDFRRRTIGVLTPARAHGSVRLLEFGIVRVKRDGTEVGTIRPGEV